MAQATVASQVHEAFDVHRYNTTQVTLYGAFGYLITNSVHLLFSERGNFCIFCNTSGSTDLLRGGTATPVDIGQRDNRVVGIWYAYTSNTGHSNYSSNTKIVALTVANASSTLKRRGRITIKPPEINSLMKKTSNDSQRPQIANSEKSAP